jgi:NAD-specific glutamate dehydrogenase
MRRGRKWNQEETIDKYFNALINIKKEMLIDKKKRVKYYNDKYQLNANLITWLLKKQIIIKDNYNNYYWDSKTPITKELIKIYLKNQSKINKLRKKSFNTELQFDMPQTPLPPKPKTRTKKVKVQEPINTPTQQNEYGLIRKFLKLIWTFLKWLW